MPGRPPMKLTPKLTAPLHTGAEVLVLPEAEADVDVDIAVGRGAVAEANPMTTQAPAAATPEPAASSEHAADPYGLASTPLRLDSLAGFEPAAGFRARVPAAFARAHGIVALGAAGGGETLIAMGDLDALDAADAAARSIGIGCDYTPALADPADIRLAQHRIYDESDGESGGVADAVDALGLQAERSAVLADLEQAVREDLLSGVDSGPVIRLVNLTLSEAVRSRASDVHLQPAEDELVIRMRIDGILYDTFHVPKSAQEEVLSRVKIMARMDIAEKRLPQDGRVAVQIGDREVDLRVSTLPTAFGERVVVRLLDKSRGLMSLNDLGMSAKLRADVEGLVHREHGIVLVTGPTGSGKTTTLYAGLQAVDHTQRNILTIEDPIEYQLPGVSQTQVNTKKGMTFAGGLRSVLRQDPDLIMVGEIRDRETAEIAIQSALTGHLVLSTLHTNSAASAVARLLDLGVEPFLIASSLAGVLAQRLVRRVCPACAAPDHPEPAQLAALGLDPDDPAVDLSGLRAGAGCEDCRQTGYRGRIGIHEMLHITPDIRELIKTRADAAAIHSAAMADPQRPMTELHADAIQRVLQGETTVAEVLRVTNL